MTKNRTYPLWKSSKCPIQIITDRTEPTRFSDCEPNRKSEQLIKNNNEPNQNPAKILRNYDSIQ